MEPTWTDIVQALAAFIAVPGAIAGFVVLFRKDKDKQEQINRLTSITQKLEVQNEISKETNKLLSKQVDVLKDLATGGRNSKKMEEVELKKLKLDYMPYFKFVSGISNQSMFDIKLHNYGERAFIEDMYTENKELLLLPLKGRSINKGERVLVQGRLKKSISRPEKIEFDIIFKDALGNMYKQHVVYTRQKPYVGEPTVINV